MFALLFDKNPYFLTSFLKGEYKRRHDVKVNRYNFLWDLQYAARMSARLPRRPRHDLRYPDLGVAAVIASSAIPLSMARLGRSLQQARQRCGQTGPESPSRMLHAGRIFSQTPQRVQPPFRAEAAEHG